MAKEPRNVEFCRFIECENLKEDECKKQECTYNTKWIIYWVTHGVYPPPGVKDA